MRTAMRMALLMVLVSACSDSTVCVHPPCLDPLAVTLTLSSSSTGGTVSNAFVRVNGATESTPCTGGGGSFCSVSGYAGTYELDIGAPGFQTVHRTVDVRGTSSASCGCETTETQRLAVALVPVS
jgi:hypothetical protein